MKRYVVAWVTVDGQEAGQFATTYTHHGCKAHCADLDQEQRWRTMNPRQYRPKPIWVDEDVKAPCCDSCGMEISRAQHEDNLGMCDLCKMAG